MLGLYSTSERWWHLQLHRAVKGSFLILWNTATTDELSGSFYGMEAFVSFNDRHPDLVSKSCLGGHSRCQRWLAEDDITSSRLHTVWMCVYACVCVHRLMSWSLNHCQSLTKAGSGCGWPGTARPVQGCRFALILPKIWQRENHTAMSACTQNFGLVLLL